MYDERRRRKGICLFSSSTVGNKCLSASVLRFSFSYLTTSSIVISLSLALIFFLASQQFLKNSNNKRKREKRKVYGCFVSLCLDYKGVIVLRKYIDQINAIVSACDSSISKEEKNSVNSIIIIKREREEKNVRIEKKQTTWSVLLSFLLKIVITTTYVYTSVFN